MHALHSITTAAAALVRQQYECILNSKMLRDQGLLLSMYQREGEA